MKKILAGCIDEIIQFDSEAEVNKYIEGLKSKPQRFKIVWSHFLDGGVIQMRIKKQYNNHFMDME